MRIWKFSYNNFEPDNWLWSLTTDRYPRTSFCYQPKQLCVQWIWRYRDNKLQTSVITLSSQKWNIIHQKNVSNWRDYKLRLRPCETSIGQIKKWQMTCLPLMLFFPELTISQRLSGTPNRSATLFETCIMQRITIIHSGPLVAMLTHG